MRAELVDRYGELPRAGREPARGRPVPRRWPAGPGSPRSPLAGNSIRFAPVELPECGQLRLQRLYPGTLVKQAVRTILVPSPMTARVGGQPLRDVELLDWCRDFVAAVLLPASVSPVAPEEPVAAEGPR